MLSNLGGERLLQQITHSKCLSSRLVSGFSQPSDPTSDLVLTNIPIVFGVPLTQSIQYAHAAIAYVDCNVQYVGFVPCIVAKCGSFLKDRGTTNHAKGICQFSFQFGYK